MNDHNCVKDHDLDEGNKCVWCLCPDYSMMKNLDLLIN